MPATVNSSTVRTHVDRLIYVIEYSVINAGETFAFTWTAGQGPALNPTWMRHTVVTQPASRDAVTFAWVSGNAPGTANAGRTLNIVLDTTPGGAITGAVVRVEAEWREQASGGIS